MKKNKRIVHLTASLKVGGAEAVLFSLITHAELASFEQCVVSFHDGYYTDRLREAGIPVYIVRGLLFRYDPVFCVRLVVLLVRLRPDLIHSLLWSANLFGRAVAAMLRIPSISVMHLNPDHGLVRNMIDRMSLLFPTRLVAVSSGVASCFDRRDRWLPAKPVRVICNGIDTALVAERSSALRQTRAALGLAEHHALIGSVGRFNRQKNYPLLIASFARIMRSYPNARLLLIGHGEEEQKLRAYAQQCGVAEAVVFVVGQMAYGYLPLLDFFVLSSDQEGVSIALLEAMSLGIPCLVTHDGYPAPHPVITDGVDGLCVPIRDEGTLADGIDRLLAERDFAASIGKNGAKTVRERWSLQAMAGAYSELFLSQTRNRQQKI